MALDQKNQRKSSWISILTRPRSSMQRIIGSGSGYGFVVFFFFSGFVFLTANADFFNLGDSFNTGQVMATTLVFGPPIGLLFGLILSFLLMSISCLADPKQRPGLVFRIPSMSSFFVFIILAFIFLAIFIPIKGREIFWLLALCMAGIGMITSGIQERIWTFPGLKQIRQAWAAIYSTFSFLYSRISGGKISFRRIFNASGWASAHFLVIGFLFVIEFRFLEGENFSRNYSFLSSGIHVSLQIPILLLKILYIGLFFLSVMRIPQFGFRFTPLKSSVIALFSIILSAFTAYGCCSWLVKSALG